MEYINALRAGTHLDEYQIREVLGQGGFGITYLADDIKLARVVALKEYLPRDFATRTAGSTVVPNSSADAADYNWGLERFLDEARTLARFDHPHLNKVHRFFEANGTAYLVLEYIDGQTLSHLLTKYPTLPNTHLQRIIREVLSGLAEVHQAGYVHRDIKPSNIMLRSDGSAVLLDFGAARQAVGQRSKSITSILTPGYAPVEQYDTKAEDVGPWSDLYALGMVAYRCISGLRDADLPDAVTRSRTQRKGGPDLASAVEVGQGTYDARFLQAIDWAIQVNEEDRPQTLTAWREAFSDGPAAVTAQPHSSVPSPSPSPPAKPLEQVAAADAARFSLMTKAALAVVGVVVLGAGLWMMGLGGEAGEETVRNQPGQSQERTETAVVVPPLLSDPDPKEDVALDVVTAWKRARAANTQAAYRAFLAQFSDDPLAKLAERKLAEIEGGSPPAEDPSELTGDAPGAWKRAQATDTPEAAAARRPPGQTCDGQAEGTTCWLELAGQPGCYVFTGRLLPDESDTWTGPCVEGLAHGTGTLTRVSSEGTRTIATGLIRNGKRHGPWVSHTADGTVHEGPFVDGKSHGQWVERQADGDVWEGPYVDDKRHGQWVIREADGDVREGPYVDGKRHGWWVTRLASGTVREGPYVDGKGHGQWVIRWADGTVGEGPYVDGKRHGRWIVRWADGRVEEGPYADGKRHGRWVDREADGDVWEGPYVDGEENGQWVVQRADGGSGEGPYVDGKRHGRWVFRNKYGRSRSEEYVNGERQ